MSQSTQSNTNFTYRNKLLQVQYYRSENKVPANTTDANVEGDWLLYTYIVQLDYETFSEMPENLGLPGEAMWTQDNWDELMPKIVDESRKHGWCVLQFYDDEEIPWRVFTKANFTDWIRSEVLDADKDKHIKRLGADFIWTDELGNNGTEHCIWFNESVESTETKIPDDKEIVTREDCFLVKFREGDGKLIFAYADLSDAILDVVYNARQIKGQMDYIGSKPGMKRLVYGDQITDELATELQTEISNTDSTTAVGATEGILKDFISQPDENIAVVIPAFDKQIEVFAGLTRLPISYYLGQRTGNGMGQEAEKTDLLKTDRKKNALFKRYEPTIERIFFEHYGITIGDLELPQDETIDTVLEDDSRTNDTSTAATDEEEQ